MECDFGTHVVAFDVIPRSRISLTTQALVDGIKTLRHLCQDFVNYFFLYGTVVIIAQRRHCHPSGCRRVVVCVFWVLLLF